MFIGGKEAGGQVTFSRFNLLFNGAGGLLYDHDDDKWVVTSQPLLDVFELYQTMAERGLLNPERAVGGQANDWSIEAFQNGTGAINLYGSWAYMSHWSEGRSHPIPDLQDTVGWTVVLPLIVPGIGAVGVLSFDAAWGGFIMPLVLLSSTDKYPVSVGLFTAFGLDENVDFPKLATMCLIYMLPVIILYFTVGAYFRKGLASIGAGDR